MIRPDRLEELAKTCIRLGIKRLKTQDIELDIDFDALPEQKEQAVTVPHRTEKAPLQSVAAIPADQQQSVAKIKELISTLSLPDDELIDKIFPNGAGG